MREVKKVIFVEGFFLKIEQSAKIFMLYRTISKTKKIHRPTMKSIKNVPSQSVIN